jgi:hypothetical protein
MKKTLAGVSYNTDQDELVYGELVDEDKHSSAYLRRTGSGTFYIHTVIHQVHVDGQWRTWLHTEELADVGVTVLPSPRIRTLETVRPLSRGEAFRWWIQNFAPAEFASDVAALPIAPPTRLDRSAATQPAARSEGRQ